MNTKPPSQDHPQPPEPEPEPQTDPPGASPPVDPPPRRRRPGAQPGNKNALKHGFYAAKFKPSEVKAHESYTFTGLSEEIALLRLYIRHVVSLGAKTNDIFLSLDLLRALSLSVGSLNRLIKTQALLPHGSDMITAAIQEIYEEFTRASETKNEPSPPANPPE